MLRSGASPAAYEICMRVSKRASDGGDDGSCLGGRPTVALDKGSTVAVREGRVSHRGNAQRSRLSGHQVAVYSVCRHCLLIDGSGHAKLIVAGDHTQAAPHTAHYTTQRSAHSPCIGTAPCTRHLSAVALVPPNHTSCTVSRLTRTLSSTGTDEGSEYCGPPPYTSVSLSTES